MQRAFLNAGQSTDTRHRLTDLQGTDLVASNLHSLRSRATGHTGIRRISSSLLSRDLTDDTGDVTGGALMSRIGERNIHEVSLTGVCHQEADLSLVLRGIQRQSVIGLVTVTSLKALRQRELLHVDRGLGCHREDRRLIRRLHLVVPGNGALVDELLILSVSVVVTTELTGDNQLDLTGLSQTRRLGQELRLRLRGRHTLRSVVGDLEQIRDIVALEVDLRSTVHRDVSQTIRPVISDAVLFEAVLEVGSNTVVDNSADLITGQEGLLVHTLLVRALGISGRTGLSLIGSPDLIGIRGHLASLGRVTDEAVVLSLGVADLRIIRDTVVSAGCLGVSRNHEGVVTLVHDVLHSTGDDNLALDGTIDRHIGLHALAVRAKHLDAIRVVGLLITDHNISGVHRIGDGELRRVAVAVRRDIRVIEHLCSEHVLIGQTRTGFTVGEHLDGVLGLHGPRLRSLTIGSVHRFVHVALLGNLHVEPEALALASGRPGGPTKISRGELRRLRVTVVGDRRSLGHRLVALRAFVGQNNLSVDILIHTLATTRCVDRVVDRHSATSLGHGRRMIGGHSQIIRRRRRRSGDAHRLFAVDGHTGSTDIRRTVGFAVIGQTRRLVDTGLSEVIDETCDLNRTVVHAGVPARTPFFDLIVEMLRTTRSRATVVAVVGGVHDADHAGRDVRSACRLATSDSLVQSLATRDLELALHMGTGDTSLVHKPVDAVLAPALGNNRLATLRVGNSVIEEHVANVKVACGTQVATSGTTGTAVISERGICTHEGSASKRHQRGSSNSLATLVLSRTRSHRTSLSVVVELKTDLLLSDA